MGAVLLQESGHAPFPGNHSLHGTHSCKPNPTSSSSFWRESIPSAAQAASQPFLFSLSALVVSQSCKQSSGSACDRWVSYLGAAKPFLGAGIPRSPSLEPVPAVSQASCAVLLWQELPSPWWLRESAGERSSPALLSPCSLWCGQSTFIWPQSPAPR